MYAFPCLICIYMYEIDHVHVHCTCCVSNSSGFMALPVNIPVLSGTAVASTLECH